jgi:hypothetical protein
MMQRALSKPNLQSPNGLSRLIGLGRNRNVGNEKTHYSYAKWHSLKVDKLAVAISGTCWCMWNVFKPIARAT